MDKKKRPPVWIGHVDLRVNNLEDAEQFYRTLGMRFLFRNDDVCILELRGGTHMVLSRDDQSEAGEAKFDLMVENIDESYELLKAEGLPLSEMTRGDIHDSFYLTDPGGNKIIVNSTHVGDHNLV